MVGKKKLTRVIQNGNTQCDKSFEKDLYTNALSPSAVLLVLPPQYGCLPLPTTLQSSPLSLSHYAPLGGYVTTGHYHLTCFLGLGSSADVHKTRGEVRSQGLLGGGEQQGAG